MVRLLHVLCVSSLCVCVLAFPVLCCLVFRGRDVGRDVFMGCVVLGVHGLVWVGLGLLGVLSQVCSFRFVELLGSWSY